MKILILVIFILFDLLTGFLQAIKNKNFKSCVMREGLVHKATIICIVGLAIFIDYAQKYYHLGFNVSLTLPVCIYVIIMEIGSILENLKKIGVKGLDKLFALFERNEV